MKSIKILIIFYIIITINSHSSYPTCGKGKNNPKNEGQCTIYGTDSGFLCCYVKDKNGNPKCQLMSYKLAESMEIKGKKTIENGTYYSCGNSSSFIKITLFSLFLVNLLF